MNTNASDVRANFEAHKRENAQRAFYDAQREAINAHRAERLRLDWYTREAIRVFLSDKNAPPLQVEADRLLSPYAYLDNVATADFQWAVTPV